MQSYLVAIRLPKTVCRRLTTLCFGIPEASWETEENFVISLYPLGKIDDTLLDEVKEMLKGISGTSPLSTVLAGAQCTPVGRSQVRLWIAIEPTAALMALQKKLHVALMSLKIQPAKEKLIAHVHLGLVHTKSFSRLADFLSNAAYFSHPSFECPSFSLLAVTPSGYRLIADFPLAAAPEVRGDF